MTRVRIWIPLLVILSSIWISRRPRVAGEEIRWVSGDIDLVGTLVTPKGSGPFPLVVFIPGSGCVPRTHRILREHAQQLSSRRVAVFVYDKRGCGDSGGDWRAVGIAELADDVLAVLPTLIDHSSIDSDHIGLMGLSQGGWISVLAAEKTSDVSFLVWLSGTPLTPAEQGHAMIEMQLRSADWDEDVIARALELDREIVEVYRSDSGWDEVRARLEDVADEPWFEESGVGLLPRDHWRWRWLASFMDYDPVPALRELEVPLLAIFGERDQIVPPLRSQRILDGLAASAPAARDTRLIPGVGHQLRAGKGSNWPDAYWQMIEDWLTEVGALP